MVLPFCFQAPLFYHLLLAFWSLARVRWSVENVPHEDKKNSLGVFVFGVGYRAGPARAGFCPAVGRVLAIQGKRACRRAYLRSLRWVQRFPCLRLTLQ